MSNNRNENPGNFANDREKASAAGQKGGQNSHGGRSDSGNSAQASGRNSGNFADNPQRAAEAGRKGGQNSHGGGRHRDDE